MTYLTLLFKRTSVHGRMLQRLAFNALVDDKPVMVDGMPYTVLTIEEGAVVVERARGSELTSVVLEPATLEDASGSEPGPDQLTVEVPV